MGRSGCRRNISFIRRTWQFRRLWRRQANKRGKSHSLPFRLEQGSLRHNLGILVWNEWEGGTRVSLAVHLRQVGGGARKLVRVDVAKKLVAGRCRTVNVRQWSNFIATIDDPLGCCPSPILRPMRWSNRRECTAPMVIKTLIHDKAKGN